MGEAVLISLTRGKTAQVSPEDAERVLAHKWCASPTKTEGLWYAVRGATINGKKTTISMHRFLLGNLPGEVDHKDGDGLNNQRDNIRYVPKGVNRHRRHVRRSTSGFYGVSKHAFGGFAAYIRTADKKTGYLGLFRTPEEAARQYDNAARAKYGEFAMLNFPQ